MRGVWGERQTGTLQTGKGYCANLGHQEDETGLVYMRARYYEPTTGRFISEDPARDGVNWYLYADGNPVNRVDPTGRFIITVLGGSGIGNTSDAEQAAASVAQLSRFRQLADQLQGVNDILEIWLDINNIGAPGILEKIAELGYDPKKWKKVYIEMYSKSGKLYRVHTFAEVVRGVVKALADGDTTPWIQIIK